MEIENNVTGNALYISNTRLSGFLIYKHANGDDHYETRSARTFHIETRKSRHAAISRTLLAR